MYQVCLVNMPFSSLEFPSLALTQLRSLLRANLGEAVDVRLLHANHDFARIPGLELYQEIATSTQHSSTGLGEWLFRQAAFPLGRQNKRGGLRPGSGSTTETRPVCPQFDLLSD